MDQQPFTYRKLFTSTFFLSAFTFGGGYVIVPLMRKKFVEQLKWIDEEEMMDMVAISQSAPGAMAVNTSIMTGYRLAGLKGVLVSVTGTVLPPLLILSVISYFYIAFRDNAVVGAVMKGMQAGVAAVIVDVVINMGQNVVKEKDVLSDVLMIAVFLITYLLEVNVAVMIGFAALVGIIRFYYEKGNVS